MRQIFFLLFTSLCFFVSCDTKSSKENSAEISVNTDSLVSLWDAAWNNNDSAAIRNLISNDMVFISEGSVEKNIDSLSNYFIRPNSKRLKNLKTSMIASGSSGNQAYYYGSYTHDLALKDTILTGISGVFSFIYTKEKDQWKIKVAELEQNQ